MLGGAEALYIIKVLEEKKAQLEVLGPATDRPADARWRVRALDAAMAQLRPSRFSINPFV